MDCEELTSLGSDQAEICRFSSGIRGKEVKGREMPGKMKRYIEAALVSLRLCGLASCSAKKRQGRKIQIPIYSPVTTESKFSEQMLILEFSFLVQISMCDV